MAAVTYEEILEQMQTEFERLTGMQADQASDIGIRLKVLAGQLEEMELKAAYLLRQAFPQTATGDYLDMHAQVRGMERKQAAAAAGALTFSRMLPAQEDIKIPAGTICSTGAVQDIRFVTVQEEILPAGGVRITVPAQALHGGKTGNVAAGAVNVMVTPPQGMETVANLSPFRGGEDSEHDDALRARLLESYRQISNGANAAFYQNIVMGYRDVKKAAVLARARGRGTVDIAVQPRDGVDFESLCQLIAQDLQEKREIGVDIMVRRAVEIPVLVRAQAELLPGYDWEETGSRVRAAVQSYGEGLEIGAPIILAALGNRIFSVEGIANYKILQPQEDIGVGRDEIGVISFNLLNQGP